MKRVCLGLQPEKLPERLGLAMSVETLDNSPMIALLLLQGDSSRGLGTPDLGASNACICKWEGNLGQPGRAIQQAKPPPGLFIPLALPIVWQLWIAIGCSSLRKCPKLVVSPTSLHRP